ncbi:MAG: hypothetical protein ACI81V_000330 [Lentimonas sp.]|jgi:hypothetical protein
MRKRREAQSSALSFMDCICCGFGAVLLLFILTAKKQITLGDAAARQAEAAGQALTTAIAEAQSQQAELQQTLRALPPQATNEATLNQLESQQAELTQTLDTVRQSLSVIQQAQPGDADPASINRPSADQSYLSGLRLRAPRAVILLESSGSMLAENSQTALELIQRKDQAASKKWARAKAAVRAVLAAIPKGTQVAVFQMSEQTRPLSGSASQPFIDPYDNTALLQFLERLDRAEAGGGANLAEALRTMQQLPTRPSSLLLIGDGLPTAPAPSGSRLTESDRVQLFQKAMAHRPNAPFNAILLPFEGDPSAAGLFWQLSAQSGGITLIPDNDWPAR